jgi:hypothetical protein
MSEAQLPLDQALETPGAVTVATSTTSTKTGSTRTGRKLLISLSAAFAALIGMAGYIYWTTVHDRSTTDQIQKDLAKDGIQVLYSYNEPKEASFSPFQSLTPTVRVQGVSGNISDAHLLQIRGINQDLSLLLNNCPITDDGLAALDGRGNVRWLEVRKTKITDEGLKHLRGMDLEALDLSSTNIGDDGLANLGKCDFPNLKTMALEQLPKVTDLGIAHLSRFKTLEILTVAGTNVTKDGIRHLKTKIPEITILTGK